MHVLGREPEALDILKFAENTHLGRRADGKMKVRAIHPGRLLQQLLNRYHVMFSPII